MQRHYDPMSRRTFLAAAGAAAASSALPGWTAASGPVTGVKIIDTHTHFYDPSRPEGVPWPGKEDTLLFRRVLPEDYKRLAAPEGVAGTVVVEASQWVKDNQWVLDLAAKEKFLVGLVGHLEPGKGAFRSELERFARNPLFRGIRVGTWGEARKWTDPAVLADLKLLLEHDLELDVNGGPGMLAAVADLAQALPELRIVINHVANVRVDGKSPPQDWVRGMEGAAEHRNVCCKVSGLVEGTGATGGNAPANTDFYRPVLDVVWNAFGAERLIYGSNWPVSERFASYATVQGIVAGYFREKGAAALEAYFRGNALRVYKFVAR